MASATRDRRLLADEMSFLLSLSNIFSVAFGIKRDRGQQWLFLGVLLDLEENSAILVPKLLGSDRLKKLIAPKRRSYNVYYWAKEFIKGFANDRGPLIDTIVAPSKSGGQRVRTQSYRLNENYDQAARKYVRTFAEVHCPGIKARADKISKEKYNHLFKAMFQYQVKEYQPLWDNLARDMSNAADEHKKTSAATMAETLLRGTNWVVLFLFFREHLLHPGTSWDTIDVNKNVTDNLLLAEPEETTACLHDFSKPKGFHILLRTKQGSRWRYTFNAAYEKPMMDYAGGCERIRKGLQNLVRNSLR